MAEEGKIYCPRCGRPMVKSGLCDYFCYDRTCPGYLSAQAALRQAGVQDPFFNVDFKQLMSKPCPEEAKGHGSGRAKAKKPVRKPARSSLYFEKAFKELTPPDAEEAEKLKSVSLRIPARMKEKLNAISEASGVPFSSVMRLAVGGFTARCEEAVCLCPRCTFPLLSDDEPCPICSRQPNSEPTEPDPAQKLPTAPIA
ncbi:hypothetical protein IJT93_10340 [bacterium]|nr:hypothetical protein [bacterium]